MVKFMDNSLIFGDYKGRPSPNYTDFNKRCRIYQKYFVDNRGEKRRDNLAITRLFNEEYRQKIF